MLPDPGYRFCPRCGGGLEARRLKPFEPERLVCGQCGFVLYLNPKVAAGTIVEHEGGVVLLRREIDPRAGFWVYPGGFVDRGETLEEAARRETREEVGLEVEITGHVGTYSFRDSEVVVVTYAARVIGGRLTVGDESLEVKSFARAEIPWDELAFPSTRLALRDYLRSAPEAARAASRESAAESPWLGALDEARRAALEARDVRAASLAYPPLIEALRSARRLPEALAMAEEGLALTHDPLLARLADEIAHEKAEADQDRC